MSEMTAGDYGGVFGLEGPGRVFRDGGGAGRGAARRIVRDFRGRRFLKDITRKKKRIRGDPRLSSPKLQYNLLHTSRSSVMSATALLLRNFTAEKQMGAS